MGINQFYILFILIMWSLILYLLFGIGHPAQASASHPTMQTSSNETSGTISEDDDNEDGDGGEKGNVRPPKK